MKKTLIFIAISSLVIFNCSKKTITNNYYPSLENGAIVGIVHPPDSGAKVTAYLGVERASTYIDAKGYFELVELPPGDYSLSVQAKGYFDYRTRPDISVPGGTIVSVDTIFLISIHDLILSVSPSDGAEQVRVTDRIRIMFRTNMNTESVENAFQVEPEVEGDFEWYEGKTPKNGSGQNGSSELHFIPRDQFAVNTHYQVTIDSTASDTGEIKLSEPYEFSFTTEAVKVVSTQPRNNDTWVSPSTSVRLSFNTDMNIDSVMSAFSMVDSEMETVTGEFVWRNLLYVEFRPQSILAANELYTVTIDTTASEVGGVRLSEPYQFSFTTEPIRILSTRPTHKETWVHPNAEVYVRFNTYMDAESVVLAFTMVDSDSQEVTGDFSWGDPRYMGFFPDATLAAGETYTVTIDINAKDVSGGSLEKPYTFWFKTRPE